MASSDQLLAIIGDNIVDGAGAAVSLADIASKGVVGIYFSAHWCPPCRGFTPNLADWYKKQTEGSVEIVFISSDRDQVSFDDYFKSMPWKALKFADREKKEELGQKYGVRGIPTLVFLKPDGTLITKEGRGLIPSKTAEEIAATPPQ